FMEVEEGQRLIGRFAPQPIYYITWKGNDALLRELNSAIADLKFNQPELETALISEYYESKLDKAILLTSAEQRYLEQKKTIIVGYPNGQYPFSYTDEESGEFAGLSRELLEKSLLWTGVQLEYREYENFEAAHTALKVGEIDIQAYCIQDHEKRDGGLLKELTAYVHLPLVIVSDGLHSFDQMKTVATVTAFSHFIDQTSIITSAAIVLADNQVECLQMLANGEVDAVLCDGYLAENQLRTGLQYQNLKISSVLNIDHSAHMVVRSAEGTELESILSKTISSISIKDINDYVFQESTYPLLSLSTFIRNNSVPIIFILLCLSFLVILVAVHMVRDSRKIQRLLYKEPDMDIWNLNYLFYKGEKLVQAERKERYAVVSLGVYNLRNYSIIFGWEAGQQLLEIIKDTLEKCIDDKKEICARYYVGRFILLLSWNDWELFVERLENIQKLAEEFIFSKTENRMQIPMGVYEVPVHDSNLRTAANCASQALELAMKGNVSDSRITAYNETVEVSMTERHQMEMLLESVDIPRNFVAYYQHKVDIRTGKIVGAEALVRFLDPTANRAVRSPSLFIPYYEQTGRIVELDFFILETVCRMLRKRLDEGRKIVPISCNFSRMHFAKPGFPEHFEAILERYQISKELIEVEITETLVMDELQEHTIRETLLILKEKDIRLSIDDFGAGYSSLGSFVHVPASTIKLDRSFLLNDENPERQLKIMRGIV
ncbi:MAG: EAL domain-containing protein, partial [Oscillospiraceae bacterium]|nr:EAL domain-containing protein [Oscillospiraceae bacterium]